MFQWSSNGNPVCLELKLDSYFLTPSTRVYARMRHAGKRRGAKIAPRRWVVNYKYERTRVCARKLPGRPYPLVERDPRKRIWLDEISTPALKVQLGWTLRRTYARIRAYTRAELYAGSMNGSAYTRVYARTKYESSFRPQCTLGCHWRNKCW